MLLEKNYIVIVMTDLLSLVDLLSTCGWEFSGSTSSAGSTSEWTVFVTFKGTTWNTPRGGWIGVLLTKCNFKTSYDELCKRLLKTRIETEFPVKGSGTSPLWFL